MAAWKQCMKEVYLRVSIPLYIFATETVLQNQSPIQSFNVKYFKCNTYKYDFKRTYFET